MKRIALVAIVVILLLMTLTACSSDSETIEGDNISEQDYNAIMNRELLFEEMIELYPDEIQQFGALKFKDIINADYFEMSTITWGYVDSSTEVGRGIFFMGTATRKFSSGNGSGKVPVMIAFYVRSNDVPVIIGYAIGKTDENTQFADSGDFSSAFLCDMEFAEKFCTEFMLEKCSEDTENDMDQPVLENEETKQTTDTSADVLAISGIVQYSDEPSDIGQEYCFIEDDEVYNYSFVGVGDEYSRATTSTYYTKGNDTELLKEYIGQFVTISGDFATDLHGVPYITNIEIQYVQPNDNMNAQGFQSYLLYVPSADQEIYSGPSYGYSYVGPIGAATNYTIVEEAWDNAGNLWGKLKSGIGWINITDVWAGSEVTSFTPYLQDIPFADQAIYAGPGYEYSYVGEIGTATAYTIVEESVDSWGNLWGRLKSGAGWINLTDLWSRM